jgi:hypothetical protein
MSVTGLLARCWAAVAAVAVLLGPAVARADAPAPAREVHFFAADTTEAGVVSLFFGAQGAPVVYYERIGSRLQRLGTRTSAAGTHRGRGDRRKARRRRAAQALEPRPSHRFETRRGVSRAARYCAS